MANSGRDGSWLTGSWAAVQLPVLAWCAWCYEAGEVTRYDSTEGATWSDIPDAILQIAIVHPISKGRDRDFPRHTRMRYVDGYPPPPPVRRGRVKHGIQIGEVDSPESKEVMALCLREAHAYAAKHSQ